MEAEDKRRARKEPEMNKLRFELFHQLNKSFLDEDVQKFTAAEKVVFAFNV
jgi:hypothetical protein